MVRLYWLTSARGFFRFYLFIDFASMANVVQVNSPLIQVELIQHSVITDSQLKFGATDEPLVWETFEVRSQFIHFRSDSLLNSRWKSIECPGISCRSDL